MSSKTSHVSFRLDDETRKALEAKAKEAGVSVSQYCYWVVRKEVLGGQIPQMVDNPPSTANGDSLQQKVDNLELLVDKLSKEVHRIDQDNHVLKLNHDVLSKRLVELENKPTMEVEDVVETVIAPLPPAEEVVEAPLPVKEFPVGSLVTSSGLAKILGHSTSTVTRWIEKGIYTSPEGEWELDLNTLEKKTKTWVKVKEM